MQSNRSPDAFIRVRFRPTSEGGRDGNVRGLIYACPMKIEGDGTFDCRLLLEGKEICLGEWAEVPVRFLDRVSALTQIKIGTAFVLWEGRDIADGAIARIEESNH